MLSIKEQTSKENLYYDKRKIQEMLLKQGYNLKLTTIENELNILMKQGSILPILYFELHKRKKKVKKI